MTPHQDTSRCELDASALEQLISLGVLHKIVALYLENTEQLIDHGRSAIQSGDFKTVANVFHTLKSSSATLGATEFSQVCSKMESVAQRQNQNECTELLSTLLETHEKTIYALKCYLEKN